MTETDWFNEDAEPADMLRFLVDRANGPLQRWLVAARLTRDRISPHKIARLRAAAIKALPEQRRADAEALIKPDSVRDLLGLVEFSTAMDLLASGDDLASVTRVAVAMRRIVLGGEISERMPPLIREIFGNPFRPSTIAPAWRTWSGGTIVKLAESIDQDEAFDRLPILADALEEAGCSDAAILEHCRGPGPHVRGCWVVDLILDKK